MDLSVEWTLIERIRAGDESAFEVIFRSYSDRLCIFAARYVGSVDVAEDLVEDVFLNIWRERQQWHVTGSLRAYLYTAVRNRSLNVLKRRRVERRHLESLAQELPAAPDSADAALLSNDFRAAASRAVADLPERCREAFLLNRQHNLSYAEIAAIMDITPKTVENQIGRALKLLRERLKHWL